MALVKRIVVYGGNGTLGKAFINNFKKSNWQTVSIDFVANNNADLSIVADLDNRKKVIKNLRDKLRDSGVGLVVNAGGGWAGDSVNDLSLFDNAQSMFNMNVMSSLAASHIAAKHLQPGGMLVLTGAAPVLEPTPDMISYGLAKASVHHLVKSLGASSFMNSMGITTVGILPITIDTPTNRKFMPDADTSKWTPPDVIVSQVLEWANGIRPNNGGLFRFITEDEHTTVTQV